MTKKGGRYLEKFIATVTNKLHPIFYLLVHLGDPANAFSFLSLCDNLLLLSRLKLMKVSSDLRITSHPANRFARSALNSVSFCLQSMGTLRVMDRALMLFFAAVHRMFQPVIPT